MGLFSRNKNPQREPFAGGARDEVYSAMSQAQAKAFREMWAQELQKRDLPASDNEAEYVFPDGSTLDLVALSEGCTRRPIQAWSELINANIDAGLEPFEEPSIQDAPHENVLVYLCESDGMADPLYAVKEPLPGLIAPIAVAFSEGILVSQNAPAELGMSADDAYDLALRNLRQRPLQTQDIRVSPAGEPYTTVHLCVCEGFAPSHVMRLGEVLAELGEPFPKHGVLLAIPNPAVMAVHVPRDGGVLGALSTLGDFAQGECELDGNGISPHVFVLRPDGVAARVTHMKDDGTMAFDGTSGPFHEMLLALGVINT